MLTPALELLRQYEPVTAPAGCAGARTGGVVVVAAETALTPVQRYGSYWLKRDDLYEYAGQYGGKVRTCRYIAMQAKAAGARGLVTAGARQSPQVHIVAAVAHQLGMASEAYVPTGAPGPTLEAAADLGCTLRPTKPGHNSVIRARARDAAAKLGWGHVPFGMECEEAVTMTRQQVANLPTEAAQLVVPVGSGMSLAGILWGLLDYGLQLPVVGVVCGADPTRRLDKYAPPLWRAMCVLHQAGVPYKQHVHVQVPGGPLLDPVYEAKAWPWVTPGSCLWVVGVRSA